MPGMYQTGDYDLAGFCVGVAEESNILDGSRVRAGDVIIGLPSSGPHSNGYSLIRKVITNAGVNPVAEELASGELLIDAVMKPTRIYVKAVLQAMASGHVSGAVHVTGGGFQENLPRSFDSNLTASIDLDSWKRPTIFKWLEAEGNVGTEEMLRTFNCGIGLSCSVPRTRDDRLTGPHNSRRTSCRYWGINPTHTATSCFLRSFCLMRVVCLISGRGTNLQALINWQANDMLGGARIVAVISNTATALGLERAGNAKIPTKILCTRTSPTDPPSITH